MGKEQIFLIALVLRFLNQAIDNGSFYDATGLAFGHIRTASNNGVYQVRLATRFAIQLLHRVGHDDLKVWLFGCLGVNAFKNQVAVEADVYRFRFFKITGLLAFQFKSLCFWVADLEQKRIVRPIPYG